MLQYLVLPPPCTVRLEFSEVDKVQTSFRIVSTGTPVDEYFTYQIMLSFYKVSGTRYQVNYRPVFAINSLLLGNKAEPHYGRKYQYL